MTTVVSPTDIANAMRQRAISTKEKPALKDEIIPVSDIDTTIGGLTHVPVVVCEYCNRKMRRNNIARHQASRHGVGERVKYPRKKCKKCARMIAVTVMDRHLESNCEKWVRKEPSVKTKRVPLNVDTKVVEKRIDHILNSIVGAMGGLTRDNVQDYIEIEAKIRQVIKA